MAEFRSPLPFQALGNNLSLSAEFLKRDVGSLDRTEALFLAAKLNLMCAHPLADGPGAQEHAMSLLRSDGLIREDIWQKIDRYQSAHKHKYTYFGRSHFLELYKWLALWSNETTGAVTLGWKANAANYFVRSAVMAFWQAMEVHDRRIADVKTDGHGTFCVSDENALLNALPVLRMMSLTSAGVTNLFALMGRGSLLMDKFFFGMHRQYEQGFSEASQLTLEEYRDCAFMLVAQEIMTRVMEFKTLSEAGEFTADTISEHFPHKRDVVMRYLDLESVSPATLADRMGPQAAQEVLDLKVIGDNLNCRLATVC